MPRGPLRQICRGKILNTRPARCYHATMLRPLLIAGTSLRVSEMALGTMNWGTSVAEKTAFELFDLYHAAGGNVIDTAHLYACWQNTPAGENGLGVAEKTIGRLLKERDGIRRHLVIISKGGHPSFAPDYLRPAQYLSPALVHKDLGESLERLGLPMIDLYFLHRDDRRVPVGEIVDMMNELVGEGKIRYFGASNWSCARIAQANEYAAKKGVMGFVASQPKYSLALPTGAIQDAGTWGIPEPADDLTTRFLTPADVRWHRQTGFPAFCFAPTSRGFFATSGVKAAGEYDLPESRARLARAVELAAKKNANANQIALAWLRAQNFPAIPLVGPSTADHLRDALAAADIRLTPDEARWLGA